MLKTLLIIIIVACVIYNGLIWYRWHQNTRLSDRKNVYAWIVIIIVFIIVLLIDAISPGTPAQ